MMLLSRLKSAPNRPILHSKIEPSVPCPQDPLATAKQGFGWIARRLVAIVAIAVCLGWVLPALAVTTEWGIGADDGGFAYQSAKLASLFFGLFIGILLTASAYLFFIWIVMRDRGQVFLLCLLISLCLYIVSTNDLLMTYSGLRSETMRNLLADYSLILSIIFSAAFTYYFLELDIYNPSFIYSLGFLGGLLSLLLIVVPLDQELVQIVLPFLSVMTVGAILVAGIAGMRQGISGSLTHIIAFSFFLFGILAESLYEIGAIREAGTVPMFAYPAFAMSALMFAIVIASQFAGRQDEKEKALALSNERFMLATKGANEGLFDWNLLSGEVFFSDQFRKILGHRLDNNAHGLKQWVQLVVNPDRRIVREALRRFRRNADINTINIEYRISYPGGSKRWLHTKIVAVRQAATKMAQSSRAQKIVRMVGSTHDITVRKQSEIALRASEARFRSITEAHPVPVMIVSLQSGRVLYASPGAEQLLDLNQELLLGASFNEFLTDDTTRQDLWQAMRGGQEVNLKEVSLACNRGHRLDAALSARRISYQGEEAMVIGLYDLTERKQAEAQISRQQEALQQSEKMAALGGLLAGVAHELNNPLSVVVGQATLLMECGADPKIVTRADKIFKAADRCSRIVKSFLALARRKPPEHKPVAINGLVQSALELLGFQIRTGNIEVVLDLRPDLPDITGDADQLTQVVTNLVLNAAQALENWDGKRRITIRSQRDRDQVVLSVADTGPGVPPDLRAKVFEPFFTTKSSKGGTGVGLSLCLNIVASHGGQVLIEDTIGGGATFIIQLPVASAGSGDAPQEHGAVDLPKSLKILLVDDEIELAQTLADQLEPEGHQIDIALNGAIALEKLRKNSFDVIISDLRMPVLDGPALYDSLARELPFYVNRIIYVTGDTLSAPIQTFLNEHPVPVVEKPYRLNDVRRAIGEVLKVPTGR
jgi:PAS domain S-box-containing protein